MKINEIHIRDPFILVENGKYYLFGSTDPNIWGGKCSTFSCYISEDLINFSEPITAFERPDDFWGDENYWAPEVHKYLGKYYMFASFFAKEKTRACHILVADRPEGPYNPLCENPYTPDNWYSLDGTLYVENGKPYSVFCHEWTQIEDGEMCLVELTDDLTEAKSEPITLFKASSAPWTVPIEKQSYVTDGPFLHKLENGKLLMLWSSFCASGYAIGCAISENGINGPWKHIAEPLFSKDGGHGMLFHNLNGELMLSIHAPNNHPDERPLLIPIEDRINKLISFEITD